MTVGRLAKVLREAGRAQKRPGASESTVLKPSGRSKYRNTWTDCGKHRHQSKKEAFRCRELHILEAGGAISELRIQTRYRFQHNGVHICDYLADFEYVEHGRRIIEDVKSQGTRTAVYSIKRKLLRAFYGIAILET